MIIIIILIIIIIIIIFCDKGFTMIFLDYKIVDTGPHFEWILFCSTFPNVDLFNKTFNFIIRSIFIAIFVLEETSWDRLISQNYLTNNTAWIAIGHFEENKQVHMFVRLKIFRFHPLITIIFLNFDLLISILLLHVIINLCSGNPYPYRDLKISGC